MLSGCNYTNSNTPLAEAEATGLEIQKQLAVGRPHELRQVPADRILAIQNEFQVGPIGRGHPHGRRHRRLFHAGHEGRDPGGARSRRRAHHRQLYARRSEQPAESREDGRGIQDHRRDRCSATPPRSSSRSTPSPPTRRLARWRRKRPTTPRACSTRARAPASRRSITSRPRTSRVYSRKHPYVPGVTIADQDPATIGAYHTSEVPYYFGTQDAYNLFRPTRNWTPWDRELSKQMTAALVAFAKTRHPVHARCRVAGVVGPG